MNEKDLEHVKDGDTIWWIVKDREANIIGLRKILEGKYYDHELGCSICDISPFNFYRHSHIGIITKSGEVVHKWLDEAYYDYREALVSLKSRMNITRKLNNAIIVESQIEIAKLNSDKRILDKEYDKIALQLRTEDEC